PKHQSSKKPQAPIFNFKSVETRVALVLGDWRFPGVWVLGFGDSPILHAQFAELTSCHARDTRVGLRFNNRGQRDFHQAGCGPELDPQEFALADADGSRLLRD